MDADREVPSGNAPSSCVSFDIQLFEAAASEDGQEDADGSAVARAVDVLADADGDRPLSEVLVPGSPLEGARGSRQAAAAGASPGQSAAGEKRERAGQSQRPEDQQHVGGRAEADAALSDLAGTGIIRYVLSLWEGSPQNSQGPHDPSCPPWPSGKFWHMMCCCVHPEALRQGKTCAVASLVGRTQATALCPGVPKGGPHPGCGTRAMAGLETLPIYLLQQRQSRALDLHKKPPGAVS